MQSILLPNPTPERLDIALAEFLGKSRAKIQKAIKDGCVLIEGKTVTAHLLVDATTPISVDLEDPADSQIEAAGPALDIIFEDADVLVVNKPSGLLVHPTATSHEPTILKAAVAHTPSIVNVGADAMRSGIVHRLDKQASGVMIMAKTTQAFRHLKDQFAHRLTKKSYTVLVMGRVMDDVGTITFPIARSTTHARMAARPLSQEGKEAVTHYTVLTRYANATLLNVSIETGRTHQIRAHFFALGFPVAGDELYIKKGVKQLPLGRLFLHARELTLTLPNGELTTFTAPLPAELTVALTKLSPV